MNRGGITQNPVPYVSIVGTDMAHKYDLTEEGLFKLKALLTYENKLVIERYALDNDVSLEYSKKIFNGLMQFFAVCSFVNGIHTPAVGIDEMWHTFVLHMREYEKFCKEVVVSTLYHDPAVNDTGLRYYEHTRNCAHALCGILDEEIWPVKHIQYERCISSGDKVTPAFAHLRKSKFIEA